MRDTFFAARDADGQYARQGHQHTIIRTNDVRHALKAENPEGLMSRLGGHYRQYSLVKFRRTIVEAAGAPAWPKEELVFDD